MAVECLRTRTREITQRDGVLEYARYTYDLKGLQGGIDEEQILTIGRDVANAKGNDERNAIPAIDATPTASSDLNRPTFRVSISRAMPGRARVLVAWGRRFFSSGPTTDPRAYRSGSTIETETLPYIGPVVDDESSLSVFQVLEKSIRRPVSYEVDRRLLSPDIPTSTVRTKHRENINRLYPEGVLEGVRIFPANNQSQYYIETTWTRRAPVRAFPEGAIEPGSRPVAELPENGEYRPPDPLLDQTAGTQVYTAAELYEEGEALPWLQG